MDQRSRDEGQRIMHLSANRKRFGVLLLNAVAFAWSGSIGLAQEEVTRKLIGQVSQQRKYSIEIITSDGYQTIAVPASTPISQRLERPTWDWSNRVIRMELVGSAQNGDPEKNFQVEVPLPTPLFLEGRFAHQSEFERLWNRSERSVVRYRLTNEPQSPHWPGNGNEVLSGQVIDVGPEGQVELDLTEHRERVKLGDREAVLTGFSIVELLPHQTYVEIEADWQDDRWVAQNIVFRRVLDRTRLEVAGRPRLLILGDETSFALHRELGERLADDFSLHHPPENCRSLANWERLGCWLGDHRQPNRQWDVVLLCFGPADSEMDQADYRSHLQRWISTLEETRSRIIWISATQEDQPVGAQRIHQEEWLEEELKSSERIEVVTIDGQQESLQSGSDAMADFLSEYLRQPK